jgi:hypothetical protein
MPLPSFKNVASDQSQTTAPKVQNIDDVLNLFGEMLRIPAGAELPTKTLRQDSDAFDSKSASEESNGSFGDFGEFVSENKEVEDSYEIAKPQLLNTHIELAFINAPAAQ